MVPFTIKLASTAKNIVETIISPQAILSGSDLYTTWQQTGHKDGLPGQLRFLSDTGLASISMTLERRDGLYYALTDVYTVDRTPVRSIAPWVPCVVNPSPSSLCHPPQQYVPVKR